MDVVSVLPDVERNASSALPNHSGGGGGGSTGQGHSGVCPKAVPAASARPRNADFKTFFTGTSSEKSGA